MRAFVTGSTGLLGSNVVRTLVEQGFAVLALVRSRAKGEAQLGALPGVTLIEGDLDDVGAFAASLQGVDVLFHTAAYFREYFGEGDHEQRLRLLNVEATVALARAAHAAGVGMFVHTSSSGTVKPRPDGPSTEADVHAPEELENLYFRSKVLADRALAALQSELDLPVVTILPGWMFGPGDAAPTSAGQLVRDHLAGKLPPVALPGRTATVDARDVALAMVRASQVGKPGERFIVAGHDATLADVMGGLCDATGARRPWFTLPYPLALTFAFVVQTGARLLRTDPLVNVRQLRTLNSGHHLSSAYAERRLGVGFRPLGETLAETVAWMRELQA